jgi:Co/Zn/Cd efflux system component
MSAHCCEVPEHPDDAKLQGGSGAARTLRDSSSYRRILWVALCVNAIMFGVEVVAGAGARSSALHADALDFLADAGNYAISLFVLSAALHRRAKASLIKGATMGAFGLWVIGAAVYRLATDSLPEAVTMGVVGTLALASNLGVAMLLFRYRRGDSNMRSVWLCTRNDAIGNVAVGLAAVGVFTSQSGWPDAVVALVMAGLALTGSTQIIRQAWAELQHPDAPPTLKAKQPRIS